MSKTTSVRYYKISLNLEFRYHFGRSQDLEFREWGYQEETKQEFEQRVQDFEATDKKYGTKEQITTYVKSFDPVDFVEGLTLFKVVSSKWDDKDFKITFVIKVEDDEETLETIQRWLKTTSLEDGEYESCGDNGWTIKTLGETMEYGLTDYRRNPIKIEPVKVRKVAKAAA